MKRLLTIVAAIFVTALSAVAQQTFRVSEGGVSWLYDVTAFVDEPLPFKQGTVNVAGHTFTLGSGTTMSVDATPIEPLTVSVRYADGKATVTAPGTLANLLTISVNGANVDITAAEALADEVTYKLCGTGESFTLHGDYKSTIVLDNVKLTATGTQPALWIDNGKRIEFNVGEGTTNTFRDASTNEKKSAFFVKGHAEWKGSGTVSISGTLRHAYSSNEYTLFKQSFTGAFNVTSAGSDGMHIEQYLEIHSGTFSIAGNKGDGIDVSYVYESDGVTPTADEQNGQFIMTGGTLTVSATADDTKGLKCEGKMTISAGRITATATGDGSRGVQTAGDLYLGTEGATDAMAAYIYMTADGDEYTDPATGDTNKCRGLKVKGNFYHYPSTLERNTASLISQKKIVDVDGAYFNLGGTLKAVTIQ